MNEYISLTYLDILLACGFVLLCILLSFLLKLGLVKTLIIAAVRTSLQLGLAGLVLGAVFRLRSVAMVFVLVGVMILLASREAIARQGVRLKGSWIDTLIAISIATFFVGITVTAVIVKASPWWTPSVAIPLFGMVIGNSLNGISLALDRFLSGCVDRQHEIETRLALGATTIESTLPLVRESLRAGMTPIINSMMIVGLVSLPGILTGQLLAGADPQDAVLYQIVVMYMIAAGTSIGSISAVLLTRKRIFTADSALRTDFKRIN